MLVGEALMCGDLGGQSPAIASKESCDRAAVDNREAAGFFPKFL